MTLHDGAQQPTASSVRSFFHRITPEKSRLIKEKVLFYSVWKVLFYGAELELYENWVYTYLVLRPEGKPKEI